MSSPSHRSIFFYFASAALALAACIAPGGASSSPHLLSDSDKSLYESAFALAERGQWKQADAVLLQTRDPVLRDVLLWRRLQDGNSAATFRETSAFIETHPQWPALAQLRQRAEAEARRSAIPPKDLIAWFERYPPLSNEGTWLFVQALNQSGAKKRANSILREAWQNGAFNKEDEKKIFASFKTNLTPQDHVKRLDALLWSRDVDGAKRMLPLVSAGQKAAAQARIAFIKKDKNADSRLKQTPRSLLDSPGLVYERVRWQRSKGMNDQAAQLVQGPASKQGDLNKWWGERRALARHYLQEKKFLRAYELASRHGLKQGVDFAEAEWLSGWISLRFLNDPQQALDHFIRLRDGVVSPISSSRANYWAGRASETLGAAEAAHNHYLAAAKESTTYYGQLAIEKTGEPIFFPLPPNPSPDDRAAVEKHECVRIAQALADIGRTKEAQPFLAAAVKAAQTPGQAALIAQITQDIGLLDFAVVLSRRMAQKGTPLIETGYPIPKDWSFPSTPEKALLLALIRQESNFQTEAVSPVGAQGLMQLMPRTALYVAQKEEIDAPGEHALVADPDYNIRLGASYLSELLDSFDGRYPLAIAAYNAGPKNPLSWMQRLGDPYGEGALDIVDWIEAIPFAETRNYVQRVLESVQVYRHRLGEDNAANLPHGRTPRRDG